VVVDFYVRLYQPAPFHACVQGLAGGVVFLCEAVEGTTRGDPGVEQSEGCGVFAGLLAVSY
ncbi:hypothetical protein, partial [Corynebacterium casei]|uniref:hypothetical protein n=1 Tax=Corynebacterium casei TaxID=160386 RepID=UPI00054EAB54